FNITSGLGKTYSPDHEFVVSRKASSNGPYVWMDISDYGVRALDGSGTMSTLAGYGGFSEITDVQAVDDGNGTTYAIWLRDKSDDIDGDDFAFYISELSGTTLQAPIRLPISSSYVTSNFAPAAIDLVTGRFYMIYLEGVGLTATYLLIYNPDTDLYTEF